MRVIGTLVPYGEPPFLASIVSKEPSPKIGSRDPHEPIMMIRMGGMESQVSMVVVGRNANISLSVLVLLLYGSLNEWNMKMVEASKG